MTRVIPVSASARSASAPAGDEFAPSGNGSFCSWLLACGVVGVNDRRFVISLSMAAGALLELEAVAGPRGH